eukprot:TRINITY_DN2261_c0_g2_i1.p1 TRINITY_DN2261_c0_g2~~TRINITY_DN2261_c0_g2_i1.p1  ORF type:complete len:208 (-),score=52.02 TRINITY_DN2261_c0_g2_i1:395-1018(-)
MFEDAAKRVKEENREFKKCLGKTYESQLIKQKEKELTQKIVSREQDERMLKDAQKELESERKRQTEKRLQLQEESMKNLMAHKERLEHEKDLNAMEKEEYKAMVEANARKELQKEMQHRNYFDTLNQKLNMRERAYERKVFAELRKKDKEFQEWLRRNQTAYHNRLKLQEHCWRQQRQAVIFYTSCRTCGMCMALCGVKQSSKRSTP